MINPNSSRMRMVINRLLSYRLEQLEEAIQNRKLRDMFKRADNYKITREAVSDLDIDFTQHDARYEQLLERRLEGH